MIHLADKGKSEGQHRKGLPYYSMQGMKHWYFSN